MRSEAREQEAIFNWAKFCSIKYPELNLLFAIPNGGSRHPLEAVNLKKQGVKSGVPDMLLPVPKCGYHGLFIELKSGKNKATDNQKFWLTELEKQGYKAILCYESENAIKEIEKYLQIIET